MFKTSKFSKTTAIALASTMLITTLGTTVTASAHDRRHPETHGFDYYNWNKHTHRNFHRTYGPGYEGEENYRYQSKSDYHSGYTDGYGYQKQQQHTHQSHKDKKRAKRAAIAAGIIGLAAGAIIASQASKNRRYNKQSTYTAPTQQPTYQYDAPQRQSLDTYTSSNEPEVITFRDTASLEPWTPGWQEWCNARYRSFNPNTGTYRGFDGLDHFCVPN